MSARISGSAKAHRPLLHALNIANMVPDFDNMCPSFSLWILSPVDEYSLFK